MSLSSFGLFPSGVHLSDLVYVSFLHQFRSLKYTNAQPTLFYISLKIVSFVVAFRCNISKETLFVVLLFGLFFDDNTNSLFLNSVVDTHTHMYAHNTGL